MEILSMIADLVKSITEIIFRLSLIFAMLYISHKMIVEPLTVDIVVVAFFILFIALLSDVSKK